MVPDVHRSTWRRIDERLGWKGVSFEAGRGEQAAERDMEGVSEHIEADTLCCSLAWSSV